MNRVALVIGNSEYLNIGKLNNPSNHLSSWGFMKKYSRWYYKDHYVEMGDLLPLPKELEPEHPMAGQELKIIASLNGEINCGKIKFSVSSNIPDGTPLLFTLRGKGYCAQCKSVVDNGVLVSEWFSDRGDAIKNGCYTVELSSPIYSILPERIQRIFGERNRNIYGSCVKFNPIGGNTIHCSFGLIIKEKSIHVIDFQEKISAL